MTHFEHQVIDVGSGMDHNWLKAQQETMANEEAEGWELVSVVLIDRHILKRDGHEYAESVSVAMYFKRPKPEPNEQGEDQ